MGRKGNEKKARNRPTGTGQFARAARTAQRGRRPERDSGLGPKGVESVTSFKHPALKQLTDQQVRFAPPARRLEQLARAEKLLAEIEPAKQYPYQFVCFRITDYRPDS